MSDVRQYQSFNLKDVMANFPPDPESKARHRAEILVKTDYLRVILLNALKGSRLHEHSAPGPITVHVVEGVFRLTVAGDPCELRAGEVVVVEPRIPHDVECLEDGAFVLTIVPIRDEA